MISAAQVDKGCGAMDFLQHIFKASGLRRWSMRLKIRADVYRGEERRQFAIMECKRVDYAGSGLVKAREVVGSLVGPRAAALGA